MTVDGIPEGAVLVHKAFEAFWWARWNDQPPPTADLMDDRFLAPLSEGEHRFVASAFAKIDDLDQGAFVMALVHRDLPLLFRDTATGQVLQAPTERLWEQSGHRWLLCEPVASAAPGEPLARVDGATLFVWAADLAAFLEHERAVSNASDPGKRQRLIASVLRLFAETGGMGEAQARAYSEAIGVRCFDGAVPLAEWSRAALQVDEGNHWHRSSPQRMVAPDQATPRPAPRLPVVQTDEPALEPRRTLRMTWQRRAIASWMLAQGFDAPPHPDMTLAEIMEAVNEWVEAGPAYRKTKKKRSVAENTVGKFVREFSMIRPYLRTMRKVEP
ncbi:MULTISPECIES: hypothetical protein [unclassified Devosia]|uniref:hypothetical protein n=1 Tax=unclassified Devosia TaxID=196773 RepID=UPI00086E9BD9|nr:MULTISPECIES: hypothetical protein [unclassified Devosia]MBN9365390.1 hypothetical protein [Devosia sp.]ODS85102.1 MAG: hypothetical protein ABS47_17690 [Devosia sp. SCN 66-27]OJX20320.1 MAG: hypothetical protein BGO83_04840 [Devosia sp. 66-14]